MPTATEVTVPDIGDFVDVPVIEVHVTDGDRVNAEDPLVTLESDKATLDVPAPFGGTVTGVLVKVGDTVSMGAPIVVMALEDGAPGAQPTLIEQQEPEPGKAVAGWEERPAPPPAPRQPPVRGEAAPPTDGVHAGPSVRRMAREFDIDLAGIRGTGPKGRITKDDLLTMVRGPTPAAGTGIPEIPAQDFSAFGLVETRPLSRIKKISGPFLHRSWLNLPHVTHDDEADITELDHYRRDLDASARAEGHRVTLLAFLVKAAVSALRRFPELNSSLSPERDALIVKGYYHIGIAVDTPEGLVVPVVRDADRKGILELSQELGALSATARDGKLAPTDMAGGTFTISSLGGIGGTRFTPIINAPEVAILGVSRAKTTPVWTGAEFTPRLVLPISLSYDHRVIDGAQAARFARHLCDMLEDDRRLLL